MEKNEKGVSQLELQHRRVIAVEQESAALGFSILRVAILVNSGAIVALLAFAGQVIAKQGDHLAPIFHDARQFLWGLLAAILASIFAYLFIEGKSAREDARYAALLAGEAAPNGRVGATEIYALVTALLVLASYGFFGLGAWRIFAALAQ